MGVLSVRGLVLSFTLQKEMNRSVRILTKSHGILYCYAPGAAKPGNRFMGGTQPGVFSEFSLTQSKAGWYVKEVEIIEPFRGMLSSFDGLTAAAHLMEIAADAGVDAKTAGEILSIVLLAFYAMNRHPDECRRIVSAAEWRLTDVLGYPANFMSVEEWGTAEKTFATFSFSTCQLYLSNKGRAEGATSRNLSMGTVRALDYVRRAPLREMFSFEVAPDVLEEMAYLTHRYLCERLDKAYNKMDLLRSTELLAGVLDGGLAGSGDLVVRGDDDGVPVLGE